MLLMMYHFLVTLSDSVAHFGLEHHESSDDRVAARTFIEADRHGFVKYCDKVPAGSIFMVPGIDVAIDRVNVVVMWPYPAPPVTKP